MITASHELDSAKIGDGATVNMYSDRKACTIIKRTDKKIWVQRDKATLLNGTNSGEPDALQFAAGGFFGHTSGKQRYKYEADLNGSVYCYSRREWKNRYTNTTHVRYVKVGEEKARGESISAGRNEHYDYNF